LLSRLQTAREKKRGTETTEARRRIADLWSSSSASSRDVGDSESDISINLSSTSSSDDDEAGGESATASYVRERPTSKKEEKKETPEFVEEKGDGDRDTCCGPCVRCDRKYRWCCCCPCFVAKDVCEWCFSDGIWWRCSLAFAAFLSYGAAGALFVRLMVYASIGTYAYRLGSLLVDEPFCLGDFLVVCILAVFGMILCAAVSLLSGKLEKRLSLLSSSSSSLSTKRKEGEKEESENVPPRDL
jgi:hypothetical protein